MLESVYEVRALWAVHSVLEPCSETGFSCFCHVAYSRLASQQFCLCLLPHHRNARILDVSHCIRLFHIWLLHVSFGDQIQVANLVQHMLLPIEPPCWPIYFNFLINWFKESFCLYFLLLVTHIVTQNMKSPSQKKTWGFCLYVCFLRLHCVNCFLEI